MCRSGIVDPITSMKLTVCVDNPQHQYDGARQKEVAQCWCKQYLQWSPEGTYLVTFHAQGIKLWAGPGAFFFSQY